MKLPRQLIDLTHRFSSNRVALCNSGKVTSLKGCGRFKVEGEESVIRYRLEHIGYPKGKEYYFAIKVHFQSSDAVVTSFSVVNGDTTDGQLWHVRPEDATGTYCLAGMLMNSNDTLVVYANFVGTGDITFRVEYLAVATLDDEPLNLVFVIDPWVERHSPSWKSDYIWWFGDIVNHLASTGRKIHSHYVVGDGVAPLFEKYRRSDDATMSVIHSDDLLNLYGTHRRGVIDQRKRLRPWSPKARKRFVEMLRTAIGPSPDIIFSISDMQILKDAAPKALHLYRDAIYCRAPFPDEMTFFDTHGLYHNAAMAERCGDASASNLSDAFVERFFERPAEIMEFLAKHGISEGKFLLLPLQDSNHYNFYDESPFSDQVELVISASRRFKDHTIVVTQHPDKREISAEVFEELRGFCPNILYLSGLECFDNVSVRLLPFCSGVIAVSTGVIFQALLQGVPFYPMGSHALAGLVAHHQDKETLRRIAWQLLTRVFYSYRYLHDGRWMLSRLCSISLFKSGAIKAEMLAVDFPANIFANLEENRRPVRAFHHFERTPLSVVVANDTSYGHAGSRAVMESLFREVGNAGHRIIARVGVGEDGVGSEVFSGADLVLVNGEGTLHHDTSDARRLCRVIEMAADLGKRIWIVNATLQDLSSGLSAVVSRAERIIVRESFSLIQAMQLKPESEVRVDSCVGAVSSISLCRKRKGIAVGVVHPCSPTPVDLSKTGLQRIALEFPFDGANFADKIAEIGKLECYVTGQYHAIYAAAIGGTPIVPIASNSHKIESLISWSEANIPMYDSFLPLKTQIERACDERWRIEKLRDFILSRATFRAADFVWG